MFTEPKPKKTHPSFYVSFASTLLLAWVVLSSEPAPAMEGGATMGAATLATALASRPRPSADGSPIDFFRTRLDRSPDDLIALRALGGLELLRFREYGDPGALEHATAIANRLAARDPNDPAAHSMRTTLALAEHRFADAIESAVLRRSVGDPGSPDGAYLLFDALWASGRYKEARTLLEGLDPDVQSADLLSRQARLLDGLGDVEAAALKMGRVVELVDAWNEPAPVRAGARTEHGWFLLHSGNQTAAVGRFIEALEVLPGSPAALEGLGWVAYGVDSDLSAASELFARSAAWGSHLDLLLVLAEIAELKGDSAQAARVRAEFVRDARVDPETERLYLRPLALTLSEDPAMRDEALELAERDLAVRMDRGAWLTRGTVLSRIGAHDRAVADARRGLEWGSPTPGDLHLAGMILLRAGERPDGFDLLKEALEGAAELGPATSAEIRRLLDAK